LSSGCRSIPATDPPLADTMQLLLPSAPLTLLLRAATLQGDDVAAAWSQWRRATPDPKAFLASDRVGIKRHLPLLYRNLAVHGVDLGRDIEPYFRAARAREEFRSVRYRRFLGDVLTALHQDGVEFLVGRGVTVGETIHTDPVLRHSHDIDLLVRTHDLPAAAAALQKAQFLPSAKRETPGQHRFDHESGLPVELHDRLYRTPFYDGELAGPFGRPRNGEILGVPVKLISDTDLLVHAPIHASTVWQRRGLSWIIDVITLLRRREAEGVPTDWPMIARIASNARAALPAYVMYQYLADTVNIPIPADVMGALRKAASKAGPLQHLAAIDGLRAELQTRRIKLIVESSGWRSRVALGRSTLFPPPAYFTNRYPGIGTLSLAMLYLERPWRFLARQISRGVYRMRLRLLKSRPMLASDGLQIAEGSAS
jgi:hypothetical protein